MPDILIRMEMPKSCSDCPFEVFGDCYGGKVKRIMDIEDYMERGERHPDCPLVELPEHGDLIDLQAMLSESENGKYVWAYDLTDLPEFTKDLPVVIPAEKGKTQ